MSKEEKDIKDVKNINCTVSTSCKYDLEILAAYMRCTLSKSAQFVLEKYTQNVLDKFVSKKVKNIVEIEE